MNSNQSSKRIIRAINAEALGQGLVMCIRLLLIPLFISSWGIDKYGYWLTLTSVAAWIGLSDLGGQLYFVNKMTLAWTEKNFANFEKVLSSGIFFFTSSAFLVWAILSLAIWFFSVAESFNIQTISSTEANVVLMIMAFKVLLSLPNGLLLAIFRATERQATSVMFVNLMLVVQLVSSCIGLTLKWGLIPLALIEILPTIVVFLPLKRYLKKTLPPEISLFRWKAIDKNFLKEALNPSLHFLSIQFSMTIIIQGSVLILARVMGPLEVVLFSSLRTVSNVLSQILGILAHSAWPEITKHYYEKKYALLFKIYSSVLNATAILGFIYLAFVIFFGEKLFQLWLNKTVSYDAHLMTLLGMYTVMNSIWTFAGYMLMATNQHKELAQYQLPINAIALFFFYLGLRMNGLDTAVIGLIVGHTLPMTFVVTRYLILKDMKVSAYYTFFVMAILFISFLALKSVYMSGLVIIILTFLVFLFIKNHFDQRIYEHWNT